MSLQSPVCLVVFMDIFTIEKRILRSVFFFYEFLKKLRVLYSVILLSITVIIIKKWLPELTAGIFRLNYYLIFYLDRKANKFIYNKLSFFSAQCDMWDSRPHNHCLLTDYMYNLLFELRHKNRYQWLQEYVERWLLVSFKWFYCDKFIFQSRFTFLFILLIGSNTRFIRLRNK